MNTINKILSLFTICFLFHGCTYLKMTVEQRGIKVAQKRNPSQINAKQIFPEKCAVVYGQLVSDSKKNFPLIVAAFSFKYGKQEIVNTYRLNQPGYYTLYLPDGQYQLYVFADLNNDSIYDNTECVGAYKEKPMLSVENIDSINNIVSDVDLTVSYDSVWTLDMPFKEKVTGSEQTPVSKYYPPGSIRSMDDEIFSPKYGILGLYNPPAFLQRSGIYFYALEEHDRRKIPVVFVHGITGTPLDWKYITEGIDRNKFEPWLFYYPSGESLTKSSNIFYEIFLSGKIIDLRRTKLIICAHSMGGLVARAAINKYINETKFNFLKTYISICSPYGGNAAAAKGIEKAPVVVPSWRDIATGSDFIKTLHETEIPDNIAFHLLFGFKNDDGITRGDNSDGTIALKSQLD